MIKLPIDNFVFRSFSTRTIKLEVALNDLDDSIHILNVEFSSGQSFALVINRKIVTHVMHIDDYYTFYGNRTLDILTFRLEREQSRLTLGKISENLGYFYSVMLMTRQRLLNLRTNFFSFWRFVQDARVENEYGICHVADKDKTLWAVFEAGDLVGGWLVRNCNEIPESLSVDRVLEEAVRISGKASYHHLDSTTLEVKATTILDKNSTFPLLLHPDSKERLHLYKLFGEKGFELASMFNGRKTVSECALEARVELAQMISLAQFLGKNNLCVRA